MPPKNVVFKNDYTGQNTVGTGAANKAVDAAAMRMMRIKSGVAALFVAAGAYLIYADYRDRQLEVDKIMAEMLEEERKAGRRLY